MMLSYGHSFWYMERVEYSDSVFCILLNGCRGKDGTGEEVVKPFTPTKMDFDIGYFELVLKVIYYKHVPTH